MKKSAFTLIELLVVISIIAILAGIALPVYGMVQKRAKTTLVGNNLRQVGTAVIAYTNDNDDQMVTGTPATWIADDGTDSSFVAKYLGRSHKVLKSPFDPRDDQATVAKKPVSLSFNTNLFPKTGAWTGNWARLKSPSQCILMAQNYSKSPGKPNEKAAWGSDTVNVMPEVQSLPSGGTGMLWGESNSSKGGRMSVVYCDGHVDNIPFSTFTDATSPEGIRRWFPDKP